MSSQNQLQPLCDVCQLKPRHGSFPFCGKRCANKAATLCNNCFTKPKFPPYEFCGKKCAASAASRLNGPGATLAPVQTIPAAPVPLPAANTRAGGYAKTLPPKPYSPQVPTVAVQQHPAPFPAPRDRRADSSKTATIAQPPVNASVNAATTVLQNVKQAFTSSSQPQLQQPQKSDPYSQSTTRSSRSSQASAAAPPPALDCLIPGCGKPVHVDENGFPASAYCSQRHREQAVNSGMVEPCIMCLSLPQGDADHFCSRLCRDEALSKPAY